MTTTIRISDTAHAVLHGLADEEGGTMQAVLEKAVEEYRRAHFWSSVQAAASALRQDDEAWQEELVERRAWEATLSDGLDPV